MEFPRSPIGFHDVSQVLGTPLFEPDRLLIKFHNLWSIEAPQEYPLLFTHPLNRFDLPFTTLAQWSIATVFATAGFTSRRTGTT